MRRWRVIVWACFLLLSTTALAAVLATDCPAIVQQALASTDQLCEGTGRNQACYGNLRLSAEPQSGVTDFTFDTPGDLVDVAKIGSLRLAALEETNGVWGVALMRLQASLSRTKPDYITLLTFGDVVFQNSVVAPANLLEVTNPSRRSVNVRAVPDATATVMGTIATDQIANAIGRTEDGGWVRVEVLDSDVIGWVRADLISSTGDLSTLDIMAASTPNYSPMQAFYFQSGEEKPACSDMPANGLLIQTPEGVGEVRLWINEVKISLGSTVFFQAQSGQGMTVTTLEGHAAVEALGVQHTAVAGTSVQVELNEQLQPSSAPSMPEAYDPSVVQGLPVDNLERKIKVHPPLTEEELAQVQQEQQEQCCPAQANNSGGNNSNGNPDCPGNSCQNNCPGNSCNNNNGNNGQSGDCPGNSCNAPGQNKDKDKGKGHD